MRRLALAFVGVLFLVAAATKVLQPGSLVKTMAVVLGEVGLRGALSVRGLQLLGACVTGLEALLGAALLLGGRVRGASWVGAGVSLGVLAVFTGVLAVLAWRGDAGGGGCGCLGLPASGLGPRADAWLGIGRNVGLIALLVWGASGALSSVGYDAGDVVAVREGTEPGQPSGTADSAARVTSARTGFTLVEVLVVIALVLVLLGLLIPAVRGSFARSREVSDRSLMRQLLIGAVQYTNASKGFYPYLGLPGDPLASSSIRGVAFDVEGYFGDLQLHWASVVVPDYCDVDAAILGPPGMPELLVERGLPPGTIRSYVQWTATTAAAPVYFGAVAPAVFDPTHFRGMRDADVVFPARKGLLVDVRYGCFKSGPESGVEGAHAGMADGSARVLKPVGQTGFGGVGRPLISKPGPVFTTLDGVAGVDE
jgi:prepilin-type N-terminal cleavage/methylation domain-containing protein